MKEKCFDESLFKVTILLLVTFAGLCAGCGGSNSGTGTKLLPTFSISPRASQNGSIAPYTNQIVQKGGSSPNFGATGNTGYSFQEWLIDGVPVLQSVALPDGTLAKISGSTLALVNVTKSHVLSASFTNKLVSFSERAYLGSGPVVDVEPIYCSSNGSYAVCRSDLPGSFTGYALISVPATGGSSRVVSVPSFVQIYGANNSGWVLFEPQANTGANTGVDLLEPTGTDHQIVSTPEVYGEYALNDSGTVLYDVSSQANGTQPAQFYTQSGWNSAGATPISPDIRGYFMNNSGVIIGASYGLGSIPNGTPVAYQNGQEVALSLVQGTLSAFGNSGTLATAPAPGQVNLYGDNGQSSVGHIPSLDIDTVSHGAGGISNPFNRVIGCNSTGDIKVIGQSTDTATLGDWGYWDLKANRFVDISARMQWTPDSSFSTILKLWAISDSDVVFATVRATYPGSPPQSQNYLLAIDIGNPSSGKLKGRSLGDHAKLRNLAPGLSCNKQKAQ